MNALKELWDNVMLRYSALVFAGAYVVYMTMEALRGFAMDAMVGGAL